MIDVPVKLGTRSYHILVGAGALSQVGTELSRLKAGRKGIHRDEKPNGEDETP